MLTKTRKYLLGLLLIVCLVVTSCYQSSSSLASNEIIPFDSDEWEIQAKESKLEDYLGQKSLLLKGGFAIIKDSNFTDGIIEYDVAFDNKRGFMGAVWRLQDKANYEEFYIRSHQSGNPDANQYVPHFNNISSWQLYYGDGYGVPLKYSFNEWIHVKIIVSGKDGEVYIEDMEKPALVIKELKREVEPGKVGLHVIDLAPGHFANFTYQNISNPPLKGSKEPESTPEGTITSWLVSNSFPAEDLENKSALAEDEEQKFNWTKLATESNGLANLAKVQGIEDGKNSVFTKVKIISDRDVIKKLQFGFSDRVKVYFNGNLFYAGLNDYGSRDYRFLGTIGLFNELYLPLKKGENELWMAVSEFRPNGWGIMAQFEDSNGISIGE